MSALYRLPKLAEHPRKRRLFARSCVHLVRGLGPLMAVVLAFGLMGCREAVGPERPISGKDLYLRHCARCHGNDGRGVASQPGARNLADPAYQAAQSDEALKGIIRAGKPPRMPGFGDQFIEPSLAMLVAYVRQLSPTKQPPAMPPSREDLAAPPMAQ